MSREAGAGPTARRWRKFGVGGREPIGVGDAPGLEDGVRGVVELGVLLGGTEHAGASLLFVPLGGGPRGPVRGGHGP